MGEKSLNNESLHVQVILIGPAVLSDETNDMYLLLIECEVRTVKYGPESFSILMAQAQTRLKVETVLSRLKAT